MINSRCPGVLGHGELTPELFGGPGARWKNSGQNSHCPEVLGHGDCTPEFIATAQKVLGESEFTWSVRGPGGGVVVWWCGGVVVWWCEVGGVRVYA